MNLRSRARALFIGVLILIVACSTGLWFYRSHSSPAAVGDYVDVAETQTLSYDGYVSEYRSSVSRLKWPRGYAAPADPVTRDTSGSYEVGSGEGDAVSHFQCAWGKSYLTDHTAHPQEARHALAAWSSVTTMPAWDHAFKDPTTRRILLEARDKAQLGDPTGIAELVKANC